MTLPVIFQKPKSLTFLRASLVFILAIAALAVLQFQEQITVEGLAFTSTNFQTALIAGYVLIGLLVMATILAWSRSSKRLLQSLTALQEFLNRLGIIALPLFVGLLVVFPVLVFGFYGRFLLDPFPRLFLFLILAIIGTTLLAAWRKNGWLANVSVAVLALGSVYLASTFLVLVNDYPFSLGWSEISRYYQASFYFSERIYGVDLPLPVTHPSRYLLQSWPFLIPDSSLIVHRAWQAFLWIAMPLLTGWILARRLKLKGNKISWLFIGWVFLFLMQGAVFYHLLPCVFIVLLGFDSKKPWRSFFFVAIASIWAGISRINWVPLPGALAALLYLVEVQATRKQKEFSMAYLWQPVLYVVGGTLIALGAYWLYIINSGIEDLSQFGSSFTSALLWERLLPNSAFGPGVLLGIVLVSAPLIGVLWLTQRQHPLGFWRSFGIVVILTVFFMGGLVVSVKIGGGTNLHNMDAFMALLLVLVTSPLFSGQISKEKKSAKVIVSWPLLTSLLTLPILFAVFSGGPLDLPERQMADDALAQIRSMTAEALAEGGQVLFISQRHLITFGLVDAPLVHEYEKLFLMEMAISHNDDYLSGFAYAIDQHRFTLIISDPMNANIADDEEDVLAAENNAWVRSVARPVLCAYEPVVTYTELGIQLLKPNYGSPCDDE
jgi:hypothetical protein